jgi:Ca-activated chloride channel family protein
MAFLWPKMLWLLAAVPALGVAYWVVLCRKSPIADRYPGLARGVHGVPRWRRHAPPLIFVGGVAVLLLAAARPVTPLAVPASQETVVLAIDVSVSMLARDIAPNRLVAAQSAAKEFVASQPSSVRLGLVQFGAFASPAQPPGAPREDVMRALDLLQPQYGTAIGDAILASLRTILPGEDLQVRKAGGNEDASAGASAAPPASAAERPAAAIILLTDGSNTVGTSPLRAARIAAQRRVRVYTVGVGTEEGGTVGGDGWATHVTLDERKPVELSSFFAAAGALALVLSALLSLAWFGRIA